MTELQVITTSGTSMVLDEATVQGFKTSLRGPLLRPGDAGYDDARHVWNVVRESQSAGRDAVRAGIDCAEVDRACRDVIAAAGWADARSPAAARSWSSPRGRTGSSGAASGCSSRSRSRGPC